MKIIPLADRVVIKLVEEDGDQKLPYISER